MQRILCWSGRKRSEPGGPVSLTVNGFLNELIRLTSGVWHRIWVTGERGLSIISMLEML
jgi:hypothetical protein